MASLVFRLTGDASSFQAAMGQGSSSLDTIGRKAATVSTQLGKIGSTLTLGVTLPAVAAGTAFIRAAADMDSLQRALLSTTGSAKLAAEQFDRLKTIAKLPGIGLEEAVRGSIRLQNYGLSADLAEKALRGFSNAVAGAGGTTEDTGEALRQLGQIFGRQKVTMDNLRIVLERVPQAAKIIREEFGSEALADPAKALEKLGVNSAKFVDVLINKLDQAPKVTAGVKTALENLRQEVNISAARIGEKLVPTVEKLLPKFESLAIATADMVDAFTKLPEPLKNTGLALAGIAIAAGPVLKIVSGIGTAFTAITGVAGAAGAGVVSLFVAPVIVGIGQVIGMINQAEDRLKDLARIRAGKQDLIGGGADNGTPLSTGALIGAGLPIGEASNAAKRLKIDLKGIAAELNLFGVATTKAATPVKDLTNGLGQLSNVIKVTSVAGVDANGALSKTSLLYIENLERTKSAVGKVKDVMFEWATAGSDLGKQLELHHAPLTALAIAADDYRLALSLARFEMEALGKMPPIQMATPTPGVFTRGSVTEASDIVSGAGGTSAMARQMEIARLEQSLARIKELNAQGKATGNDVIAVEQALKRAIDGTTESTKKQSRALQQVSTILTDLSRNVATSFIGLFPKVTVDTSKFKEEISELEAEQQKLLASQAKGNIVTTQLAAVQLKLADANRRMGDELKKATLGFRGMEAGKAIVADLAKSITRTLIEGSLTDLGKKLVKLTADAGVLGKVLNAVFGKGADIGNPVIKNAVPGGIPGGGAGSAAGAASSGLAGIVTAFASVGSLISGIVGNFQFAHMNTALGRIEESTRFSQIHLLYILEKANEYWPYMKHAWESLVRMETRQIGVVGGGGMTLDFRGAIFNGGVTQAGVETAFKPVMEKLKRMGIN